MFRNFRKVPDVPDSLVITVMRADAHARNAYKGEPGTSGTSGTSSHLTISGEVAP